MANKSLFSSIKSWLPRATATNEAGGAAYRLAPKHALAQIAATGCFNGTYYATGASQLDELRKLIDQVDDNTFLAKLAVYARETGQATSFGAYLDILVDMAAYGAMVLFVLAGLATLVGLRRWLALQPVP